MIDRGPVIDYFLNNRLFILWVHQKQIICLCILFSTTEPRLLGVLIHSRFMKTQHIKFEILNERLSVVKCNLKQLNLVQNILVIGRIWDGSFHPFGDVRDDVTRSLDVCHR